VLADDYIRTARSKGLTEKTVLVSHALKNALIPIITVAGMYFAILLGGTVVMEMVFNLPGIGRALVDSLFQRDYAVTQGILLTLGMSIVAVNLIVDILYGYIDPRLADPRRSGYM
jgi:glutathione transport system permease protein